MAQPSRNSVPRPPRPDAPGRTVTVVSPPDSTTHGRANGWPRRAICRASAAWTLPTSRDSPSISSPRMCASMPAARAAAAAASSDRCGVAMMCTSLPAKAGVAGLGRLELAALEPRPDPGRDRDRVAVEHRQRVGAGGRIGHRRAAADGRRRVAGHVAHQQAHDLRRRAGARQPAALDRRQVLPHAVHLVDRGAALQQRAG